MSNLFDRDEIERICEDWDETIDRGLAWYGIEWDRADPDIEDTEEWDIVTRMSERIMRIKYRDTGLKLLHAEHGFEFENESGHVYYAKCLDCDGSCPDCIMDNRDS